MKMLNKLATWQNDIIPCSSADTEDYTIHQKIVEGLKIGHILCDELVVQGIKDESAMDIDLVVHPIGVGMFSEEQFQEWIDEAQKIATTYNTMIIGTSHADGSFGNTGVSIPIAYCFDKNGEVVFISKNDIRPRILDFQAKNISISQEVTNVDEALEKHGR